MAASYPGGFDTMSDPSANLSGPPLHSTMHNQINDVIEAIEAELGINPSGSYATVAAALAPIWTDVAAGSITFVQNVTTVTKTAGYAAYQKYGTTVRWQGHLTATGAGAGGGIVSIGLPFAARAAGAALIRPIGTGIIFDTSASAYWKGIAVPTTTTTMQFVATSTTSANFLGAVDFTAALAAGDTVSWDVVYEAAA